jgi:hypothetical protein
VAVAFDRAGVFGPADFNGFEGGFCDSALAGFLIGFLVTLAAFAGFPAAFPAVLPALAGRVFVCSAFDDFAEAAQGGLATAALGDFLRVFLDIRLPFVAFGGSISSIAGLALANRNHAVCWASLMASEYGY